MSNTDYETFKNAALENSILRIPASFGEFEFVDSSHLELKCRLFTVSPQAIRDISGILGMAANSLKNIDKTLGKAISIAIYNNMLRVHAKKDKNELLFVIRRNGEIVRVMNRKSAVFSNKTFFEMAERVIESGKLDVHEMCINPEGELVIRTRGKDTEFQVMGFRDEVFESGLSIANTHFGLDVDPYMHRLVCSNGMVTKQFEECISLKSSDNRAMNFFFDKLYRLEERKFKSAGFSRKVKEAIETPASVYELMGAVKLLKENAEISKEEVDSFIEYKQTFRDYMNLGIDLEKVSVAKKRNARSGVSMWKVINGITDFASHNYGYKLKNNVDLQVQAGNMLCKPFDIANTMEVCPY